MKPHELGAVVLGARTLRPMDGRLNMTLLPRLARKTDSRILFVVLDGLGGVIGSEPTALERAACPNLDALAAESALGRTIPVTFGVTPGSGPGHFAVFGYDPLEVDVGRGLLEALGVGADVRTGDVAIRGNYCTLDGEGLLLDRRAGRIATELSQPLTKKLGETIARIDDVEVHMHPLLQHRFAAVLRGPGLAGNVADTDPQEVGVAPFAARALDEPSHKTAVIANTFVKRANEALEGQDAANGVLLRGFGGRPQIPTLPELAQLSPCAVAAYPAYRGVAELIGMHVVRSVAPTSTIADEVDVLESVWNDGHDFFFLHVKGTDSAGEDGDTDRKAAVIEAFDKELPRVRALNPDVIVITGDHSTPGPMAAHSWHPVPTLLWGPWCEPDTQTTFDEHACHAGRLGIQLPSTAMLRLALASAGKLAKYGA